MANSNSLFTEIDATPLKNRLFPYFFRYLLIISCVAWLAGFIANNIIRWLKLDTRIKLFRFKNEWFYVFSSELLQFKKFRDSHAVRKRENSVFLFAIVDVQVQKNASNVDLYSGVLVDYDLNPRDISKIDRLYLSQAKKYILIH